MSPSLILFLLTTLVSNTLSHCPPITGFHVALTRVDSNKNFTKSELLNRARARSQNRMKRLIYPYADSTISSPVHAGEGEFLMELSIGTPPMSFKAVMDTGSDLVWIQCEPCTHCYDQTGPIFDPLKSNSFVPIPCSHSFCTDHDAYSSCIDDSCNYFFIYEDNSTTEGIMVMDTFTFNDVKFSNIGFGCGLDNDGGGPDLGAGLVGMGRGPLSLISQLKEPKFSYCLAPFDSPHSSLFIGNSNLIKRWDSIKTTPLIKSTLNSFYHVSLEGISVGGKRLNIHRSKFELKDDGTGGTIIDSGSTLTGLEECAFKVLKEEFIKHMGSPLPDSDDDNGLCFRLPPGSHVPGLVFHFRGADLEFQVDNYMMVDKESGEACLAIVRAPANALGMSVLGNIMQTNMLVAFDLEKESVSFVDKQCGRFRPMT